MLQERAQKVVKVRKYPLVVRVESRFAEVVTRQEAT
jgi:hypothetical protein